LVPQREQGMTAYEMLLSESQERMLIVAHKGREREVGDIFRKWDLDAVVIGQVRDDGRMRVAHNGETVCDVPVKALTDEAPIYQRPMKRSADILSASASPARAQALDEGKVRAVALSAGRMPAFQAKPALYYNDTLLKLLASPNLASKEWVYRQYDHMVRTNTAVLPGADAAVVRIKETRRALAISLDGNGRYCTANPREGAKLLVAEAARNVVCVGAQPIAITNCLNFASPERPEVMWSFSEVIDGMAEACRAFNTPVVSGNVSFYNETEGRGILPTPVIGMIGLIDAAARFAAAIHCPRMMTYIMPSSDTPKDELRQLYKQRFTESARILARSNVRLGLEFLRPLELRKAHKYEFIWRMNDMLAFAREREDQP